MSDAALFVGCAVGSAWRDRVIQRAEAWLGHDTCAPQPLCNHTFILCRWRGADGWRWQAVEAAWPRVRVCDPRQKTNWVRYYRVPCTAEEALHAYQWTLQRVGRPYNALGLARYVVYAAEGRLLNRRAWASERQDSDQTSTLFCSELCVDALRLAAHVLVLPGMPASNADPARLETYMSREWTYEPDPFRVPPAPHQAA